MLESLFLYSTSGGCVWQSYHGTVKSAGVSGLWFCTSTCFQFWSKAFKKCCTNNFLPSLGKTIFSLLELIGHMLLISEYVLENINCFGFWWKTYTKRCTSELCKLCNIMCQKDFLPLHFVVGQVLSVSEYDLENRRILCKQKYCIKNIVLKVLIHSWNPPPPY